MEQSEVNFTKKLAYAFDYWNHPNTMSWERCQQGLCLFKPTTKIWLWPIIAIPKDWPFWKKHLVLQNVSCKYWEVIQQLVPLSSLHAGIGIRAEQAECLHFFLMHSFEGYGQKVTRCFLTYFLMWFSIPASYNVFGYPKTLPALACLVALMIWHSCYRACTFEHAVRY